MNKYMNEAINEALKTKGFHLPNPMVGAIIVKDNTIIGRGFHENYGSHHAEINAINDAKSKGININGSTMYVTLEPCSKEGKTPACSQAIIKNGINKVVMGSIDKSDEGSIKDFKEKGIEFDFVDSKYTDDLIKNFSWNIKTKKPYVIAKIASYTDGQTSANKKKNIWISNQKSTDESMNIRYKVQGILVGANTVRIDNPLLTTRKKGYRDPNIIIITRDFNIPIDSKIFDSPSSKYIFIKKGISYPKIKNTEFIEYENKLDTNKILDELFKRNIKSILVEGGKNIMSQFFKEGNVNELDLYIANKEHSYIKEFDPNTLNIFNGSLKKPKEIRRIENDIFYKYILKG